MLWDFGSAAKHHRLYALVADPANCHAGMLGLRGAIAPSAGLMEDAVRQIKGLLEDAGVAGAPVGVDIVEPAFLFEMQRQGLQVVDAQQLHAGRAADQSADEIMLLNQAAAMVDGGTRRSPRRSSRACARTSWSRWPTRSSTRRAPTRSRRSTRSAASGATRIRTTSPTASSGRGTRRSSTSSTRSTATGPATTGTFSVGSATSSQRDAYTKARSGWTRRSISSNRGWAPTRSPRCGRRRPISGSPARWTPSGFSSATGWAWACTSGPSFPA